MQNKNDNKSKELIFKVLEADELLTFIMKKMDGISRTKAKNILTGGSVAVNGKTMTQHNFQLVPGMEVRIGKNHKLNGFDSQWIRIVYEDQYLFVVDKKPGIICHSPNPEDETVQSILNQYLEKTHQKCHAHTVHRLDRDTSGLLIFAKDKKIALKFEENWKETVYDRRYVALVHGEMKKKEGTISSYLKDNAQFVTYSSKSDNGGKLAVTHYKLIKVLDGYSLVELRLDTGRKNQIRVHLQDIGFPVVGDPKYGDGDDKIGRLGLHAFKLCFKHPVTGQDLKFETPIPRSFELHIGSKPQTGVRDK